MSPDQTTVVLLCVCLITDKLLFVASAPSTLFLIENTESHTSDVHQTSTQKLDPLVNLYRTLKRETLHRNSVSAFGNKNLQRDPSTQIYRREETHPKTFKIIGSLNSFPQTSGTWRETAADDNTKTVKPIEKRRRIHCDLSKVTLNMLVEYFRYKTLCGQRASQIRFGLGK